MSFLFFRVARSGKHAVIRPMFLRSVLLCVLIALRHIISKLLHLWIIPWLVLGPVGLNMLE